MDDYVIRNVGIKLCKLKCSENGQCLSIEYDIETLTCRLSRVESKKIEKKEGQVILARDHLHVSKNHAHNDTTSLLNSDSLTEDVTLLIYTVLDVVLKELRIRF